MIEVIWTSPTWVVLRMCRCMTAELFDNDAYSHTAALGALFATSVAFVYALYILAYPPMHRKLSVFLLAIPVTFAFWHHDQATPISSLSDTYGRFLYIWLAHMSYEVTILEYEPELSKENIGWKNRVRQAYKVLFARNHAQSGQEMPWTPPKHNHSTARFLVRHAWTAIYSFVAQYLWYAFTHYYVRELWHPELIEMAYFFRRLPSSFTVEEMWSRFSTVVHWCILNMLYYEGLHSFFAIFFVGTGFDNPSEWSMSLFGPLSEAWSVRQYWGRHWHNYIYYSFSGHTKVITRDWLGMKRGHLETRLLENTVIFGVSGVMHSLVRWIQDGDRSDCYAIAIWYVAQMLPIVIEGIVQDYWHQTKKELGIRSGKWTNVFERAIGYAWVIGWKMWSIPKYINTREMWSRRAESAVLEQPNLETNALFERLDSEL